MILQIIAIIIIGVRFKNKTEAPQQHTIQPILGLDYQACNIKKSESQEQLLWMPRNKNVTFKLDKVC